MVSGICSYCQETIYNTTIPSDLDLSSQKQNGTSSLIYGILTLTFYHQWDLSYGEKLINVCRIS